MSPSGGQNPSACDQMVGCFNVAAPPIVRVKFTRYVPISDHQRRGHVDGHVVAALVGPFGKILFGTTVAP